MGTDKKTTLSNLVTELKLKSKMGKRNKETNVGRRRPMIQLGNSQKQGLSAVSRNNINKEEPTETPKKDEIDDQLAGFLAEINSLETPSDNDQHSADTTTNAVKDEENSQQAPTNMLYDPEHFDPATQGHLLPEPWHACYDDRTMCYYYWNTATNEVQWYPPVATIPPPPPLPAELEVNGEENKSESIINEEKTETTDKDPEISSKLNTDNEEANNIEVKVKDTTKKDFVKNDDNTDDVISKKEKDKEYLNQIKEKI